VEYNSIYYIFLHVYSTVNSSAANLMCDISDGYGRIVTSSTAAYRGTQAYVAYTLST